LRHTCRIFNTSFTCLTIKNVWTWRIIH